MVHMEHEVSGNDSLHFFLVHAFKFEGVNEAVDEIHRCVVSGNVVSSTLSDSENEAHQTRHSGDEIERVLLPVLSGFQHPQGVDADAQPIHWVTKLW